MTSINRDFEWLYPGLLQKEELIKALTKRFIKRDDLNKLDKNELVELYQKYIIPLPQRKYRQNRRGRQMTKQQVLLAKKRRHSTTNDSSEPPQKKQPSSGLVTSFDHLKGSTGDRIKPPPSCINFERKTVKLNSPGSSSPHLSSKLDKLTLSKNKSLSDSKSDSPEKKLKLNDADKKGESSDLKAKTIKLINKQIEHKNGPQKNVKSGKESENQPGEKSQIQSLQEKKTADSISPMDTSETGQKEKKKVKITRISWP